MNESDPKPWLIIAGVLAILFTILWLVSFCVPPQWS